VRLVADRLERLSPAATSLARAVAVLGGDADEARARSLAGLEPSAAIAAVRAQGGLIGIAHPFDRFRGSLGKADAASFEEVAAEVDWIEAWNARLMFGDGNERAAALAGRLNIPGVAVSDAHTIMEVAIAATRAEGDPQTPEGLRAALAGPLELVTGRASAYTRLIAPAAKLLQHARGRGRVKPKVASR